VVDVAATDVAPGTTQFELVIGGMTCAACAARVQAKLNKLDGVAATVNLATERAHVTAPARVSVPDLVRVVQGAGYSAELAAPERPDPGVAADDAAVRRLRRRLVLALVFFVPLTDLSIVLSVFPWSRFPGWQWLLVALAAPVATWAAWPFHQAALKQARHLSSSMDTLVSMGILAACGWSVYAIFFLDRSRTGLSGVASLIHASGGGIYLEVAASVTTFLLAGRLYEARARRGASEAMRDLAAAGAKDVCVLGDDGAEHRIPADLLRVGQRFVVRPGERIAADGQVLSGQSAVDRSMMTGESVPVDAAEGDGVTGGTIVLTGRLVVRARGVVDGHEITIGRDRLFADRGVTVPADLADWCGGQERAGRTTVLVAWDEKVRGALAVADTVKPSAPPAVAALHALGLRTILLTGDNAATAQAVAAAAGIGDHAATGSAAGIGEVISGALPAAKAQVIADLEAAGRCVAMVGDGVNDAPALAAARLGLALGSGTDVAICAADMILLRDDLQAVPDAIALARATFRTIRRNLAWAFCYNLLALPLAALGFLNPLIAAATMTLSSVFVVWNSLRLRRFAVPARRPGEMTFGSFSDLGMMSGEAAGLPSVIAVVVDKSAR
jgi:cation-transporting P-type ATPase A/B/Cu+-exporting ATPase